MPDTPTPDTLTPSSPATTATPPRRWLRRLAWSVGGVLALLAALTALLTGWLPDWVRPRLEVAAQDVLGTPVSLGPITLQPWALALQVGGVRIGPAEAPLFKLDGVQVQLASETLWRRAPVVRSLTLQAPQAWVQRTASGAFNFSPVLAHVRDWRVAHPPSPEPTLFALHNIRLSDGQVHYQDDTLGQRHEVTALQLGVPFLSNLPSDVQTEVQPQLSAALDGSQIELGGHAKPFAPGQPAELTLHWQKLALHDWAGLLKAVLPPDWPVDLQRGLLDAELKLSFERPITANTATAAPETPRLQVQGDLTLSQLQLALPAQHARVAWQQLKLSGLDLAPLQQRYALAEVALQGLDAAYTLTPAPAATTRAVPAAATAPAASASTPQWQIGRLSCADCQLQLRDARTNASTPTDITLKQTNLSLAPLSSDLSQPLQLQFAAAMTSSVGATQPARPGQIALNGTLHPQPLALQAHVKLDGIDLRVAQPYMAPYVNLTLIGGALGTDGQLTLSRRAAQPGAAPQLDLDYQGRLAVADLRTQDSVTGADFVQWKSLGFQDLKVALRRDSEVDADLGRISLDGLQARLILHPDAHLNVADIVKPSAQAEPKSLTTPQSATSTSTPARATPVAAASNAPKLRWQEVRIDRSSVYFSDYFIKPNYSARLTQLKGSLSALSSSAPQPAQVEIAGALDDGAPLRIAGRFHPLGARLFTDIEASARGIALTRLSTYAERYAGYAIDRGSLSVNLRYKIDQGQLQAENQLFLDQLTFGNEVASADATQLPVRLAVALLKNGRGEIDLRLPVAGTLDDPQFSVGGIVWKLVLNLINRAVTAPFALLMGGESEELAQVEFAPGSAELSPAARERLDTLAQRLQDRPAVKLEATAEADPVSDGAALQPPAPPATAASGTAAPASKAAAPTPAASAPAFDLPAALRTLADRRADAVMAYLSARLPAERVLINRSVVAGSGAVQDRGPSPRVQFTLR